MMEMAHKLFFKLTKPLCWKEGIGLDLVAYRDQACTDDLFRWPEFCKDQFPPRSQTMISHQGQVYFIEWMD